MDTRKAIQDAAGVTIETFEKLIALDEQRRKELLAELSALRVRQRVIAATEDAAWVTTRFIEPRLAELRALDARITVIRGKLDEVIAQLSKPAPKPQPKPALSHVWMETHHPTMIALAA